MQKIRAPATTIGSCKSSLVSMDGCVAAFLRTSIGPGRCGQQTLLEVPMTRAILLLVLAGLSSCIHPAIPSQAAMTRGAADVIADSMAEGVSAEYRDSTAVFARPSSRRLSGGLDSLFAAQLGQSLGR